MAVAVTLWVGAAIAATWPVDGGAPATAALLVATGLVVVLADRVARVLGAWAVTGVAALGVVGTALVSGPDAVHPHFGVLGYANANAAWYAAGVGAACVVAIAAPVLAVRVAGWGTALGLGVLPVLSNADAATIGVVLTIGATAVVAVRPSLSRLVAGTAVAGAAVLWVTTIAVGIARRSGGGVSLPVFGEARPRFWGEAVALVAEAPVRGWGAHGFARLAPSAADPDQAWAHHEFLELAVEHGILLTAVVALAVAVAAVALVRVQDPAAAVGAVTLAVGVALASVDYVWLHAAVPVTLAAVVGAALGRAAEVSPGSGTTVASSATRQARA